jgi:hypothetical protein
VPRRPVSSLTLALGALVALWGSGCRCASDAPPRALRDAGAAEPRCRRENVLLTLAPSGSTGAPGEAELEANIELPFSVEAGASVALGSDFFVSALRHETRGAMALVARFSPGGGPGQILELQRLHGDVIAPRLAADSGDLVVALAEATSSGHDVMIGRLGAGSVDAPPVWQRALSRSNSDGGAYELGAQGGVALLVWDEWMADQKHGGVRVLALPRTFAAEPSPAAPRPKWVSRPGVDAEAPRISPRVGGFWLAWIANTLDARTARARARIYDPADETGAEAGAHKDRASAPAGRHIELVPLDGAGEPMGEVMRLGSGTQNVVGFDLASSPSGRAWVAWRQGAFAAAAPGGELFVAEVGNDGAQTLLSVRDSDVGAGEPSWVSGTSRTAWLSFPNADDVTVLASVEEPLRLGAPWTFDRALWGAAALAASDTRVLLAAPRGRALELFSAVCRKSDAAPGQTTE